MSAAADRLSIDGREFARVVSRGPVAVYRGDDCFLRIGPPDLVSPELETHQRLVDLNFPVPDIIASGTRDGRFYYIESSAGPVTFGDRFDQETQLHGSIQPASFDAFLEVVSSFARAQLQTASVESANERFAEFLSIEHISAVLPDHGERVTESFTLVLEQLHDYPAVVTHGDFHAFNVCERGVIDFETVTVGPAGYDLISALQLPGLFPPDPADYFFSAEQSQQYLEAIDSIFMSHDLARPSRYLAEFGLCKIFWLVSIRERPSGLMAWLDGRCVEMVDRYLGRQ